MDLQPVWETADTPNDLTPCDAAHWYAARGCRVLPVVPGGKRAALSDWPDKASADHAQIDTWWAGTPNANVGVLNGDPFDVVDVDGDAGRAELDQLWPDGWPNVLGTGWTPHGMHLWIPAQGQARKIGVRPKVDYMGAGGYVVAPPSVITATSDDPGGRYEWAQPPALDPAADAAQFAGWLEVIPHNQPATPTVAATPATATATGPNPDWVEAMLTGCLAEVRDAAPGRRNDTLNRVAYRVGKFVPGGHVNVSRALTALVTAAQDAGLPGREAEATARSGLDAGQLEPLEPPAPGNGAPLGLIRTDQGVIDAATGEVLDDDEPVSLEQRFFAATTILATIRQAAHSRLVTPWSVLGAVLARVTAEVPPHVVLPPLVGSDASLNLAVALVAGSGGGKSGAVSCAQDLIRMPQRFAQDIGPGSGEGLMMAFLERDPDTKTNVLKPNPLALLAADEVAQIGTVQGRASQATFGPVVRTMLTGGAVSTTAADPERRRSLPANSYRLCIVSGVQPKLSDVLLADTDAGTPQRWLWLPADDPQWDAELTKWPGSISWRLPAPHHHDADGRVRIEVPDVARQAVYEARIRQLQRQGNPLDGHRLLTRLKVAAALALLHSGYDITPHWWQLAGVVMHRSDITRGHCVAELAAKAEAEQRGRGRLDAVRESGAREARTDEARKYAAAIWRTVASTTKHNNTKHEPGAGCTGRCIANALRNHKGADKDAALRVALDLAWIEERDCRYFPGASQPSGEGPA